MVSYVVSGGGRISVLVVVINGLAVPLHQSSARWNGRLIVPVDGIGHPSILTT